MFVTVLEWPHVFSCRRRTAGCLQMGLSDGVSNHCACLSVKFLLQRMLTCVGVLTLPFHWRLPCRQFLRQAMEGSWSQSEGSEAGDHLLCRYSSEVAFQNCSFPGELSSAPQVLHMDFESASLLLMSTSSSRSFAFMCLYSLYSSAIGVRSSFWTFLPFCLKKLSSKS